ncbi:MAG TPA: hypothetical protein DIW31_07220 [Bacteroidales bacterium]|nr:hypothetical protein [Bacteroidales bacterium]
MFYAIIKTNFSSFEGMNPMLTMYIKNFLSPKIHRILFLIGCAISLCSLPFSKFTLSIGLFFLTINWLLEGNWRCKALTFINRKSLWIFLLVYLSVLISFFYSDNTSFALKELKLWLPILLIPIVIGTSKPITNNELKYLFLAFCIAVFVSSIISLTLFIRDYQTLGQDLRYLSPFVSHIRLSLMVNLSIFILIFLALKKSLFISVRIRLLLILLAFWFVLFLFILQSVNGIIILFSVIIIVATSWVFKIKSLVVKILAITIFVFSLLVTTIYITHAVSSFYHRNTVDFKTLPHITQNGNPYIHDTLQRQYENSNLVWINICSKELIQEWDRLCKLYPSIKGRDYTSIEFGLIRYLTSKGLNKDSIGVSKLDSVDFKLINNNVSSVIFREHKFGVYPRLYQLLWEIDKYRNTNDPNGSTLLQRYIYFKASWAIIKKHILFGVGVGDGQDFLMDYYSTSNVNLDKQFWFLSHNQYLTIWIASGLVGLILFISGLLIPSFIERKSFNILSIAFLSIILISMLTEDTLETHVGITFTALFYSFIIFGDNFSLDKKE